MRTKLTMATALAGTLLATCLVSGSAQATSLPVLKGDATPGIVTLVGRGGGHGGGHRGGGGGHSGGHHGGGHHGGKHHGGGHHYGGGAGKHHGGGHHYGGGGGKYYAHKGRHNRRGHYGWYGLPYGSYGYGGGCGRLYRNAIATGSSYWWNRYYECIGY
jgi:hypothetical protein